jgi:hypothetical protein
MVDMTEKRKKNKKVLAAASLLAICVTFFAASSLYFDSSKSLNDSYLNLSHFNPNATLNYEIFSNGEIIEKGNKQFDKSGSIKIDTSSYLTPEKEGKLAYRFDIQSGPQQNQTDNSAVNFLIKLDRKTGGIEYTGSGLASFQKFLYQMEATHTKPALIGRDILLETTYSIPWIAKTATS